MPVLTSIFLALSLLLAVLIGAQTRQWTWGPSILSLGLATLFAIVSIWQNQKKPRDLGISILGFIVTAWFAWRASVSPVSELALSDMLLLASAVATYLCIREINGHTIAENILSWSVVGLLLASVVIGAVQYWNPGFRPIFADKGGSGIVTGFYSHYNEAANYFIGSSLMVLALAFFGRNSIFIRLILLTIAVGGLICVWHTHSRGGVLGMAISLGVFAIFSLIICKRRKSRFFAPLLVILPLIGIGVAGFLLSGWHASQEARNATTSIEGVFDNVSRLYFLGIAISCIALHPLFGGGSRSFSWECFRFVDGKAQGDIITHRPELVHNEILQAATDYGLLGATLIIILIVTFFVISTLRLSLDESHRDTEAMRDAWRVGGISALVGMLVQSSFSFVFHLLPGVILLGICLAQIVRPSKREIRRALGNQILLTITAAACCVALILYGWKGTNVTYTLWNVFFGKNPIFSLETRIERIGIALQSWPLTELYQERALSHLALASSESKDSTLLSKKAAVEDYRSAAKLNPFYPAFLVNKANLLSELGENQEAEDLFAKAIQLQGGMEPAFRGFLSSSIHHLRKGVQSFSAGDIKDSLFNLEIAADQVETACQEMHWIIKDMVETRLSIHESLGRARESSGDYEGALSAYQFASTLQNGNRVHYRIGSLFGTMASEAWKARRSSEALGFFIKAKQSISIARDLPNGVTPSQRVEYLAYLDQTIAFLKAAKVEPPKHGNGP